MDRTRTSAQQGGTVQEPIYEPIPSEQCAKSGRIYNHTTEYWGRKPWNVIRRYIQHFAPEKDSLVADPFAGGGVTVGESLRTRHRVIGMDVQPLSELVNRSLIADVGPFQVWSAAERVKAEITPFLRTLRSSQGVEAAAEFLQGVDLSFLDRPIPANVSRPGARTFLDTFDPRHLAGLLVTREAISAEPEERLRTVLWLAFANMLRYANRGYEGKTTRTGKLQKWRGDHIIFKYKRLGAVDRFTYIDFEEILSHCLERVYKLKNLTDTEYGEYLRSGQKAWFFKDDAAKLSHYVTNVVGADALDYVLMDPPYSDLVKYSLLLEYWNVWLPDGYPLEATPLEAALQDGKDAFAKRLTATIADAASVLKHGGWLTLFYLDIWDFGLWHQIIEEAANARLEHINSTWNPQQIASATQNQNPLSGIRGAVIANFRRVRSRVRATPPAAQARPIETPLVYLEHQLHRVIVENLGATTSEVLSHISDEIYTRFALEHFAEEETRSVPALLKELGATELEALQPAGVAAPALWTLRDELRLDEAIDPYDRLRYRLFVELARRGEASAAELLQSVYEGEVGLRTADFRNLRVKALLSTFAEPISATARERGGWRINWKARFEDVQLRLLLSTTTAHRLREAILRERSCVRSRLNVNLDGIAQLAAAGPGGPTGPAWKAISRGIHALVTTVRDTLGDIVESVWAVREFAEGKWDGESPGYDDLPVLVILRPGVRDPLDVEEQLLQDLFWRLYRETRLNFVPYFRIADDTDLEVLFGIEDERVLLVGERTRSTREHALAS